MNKTIADCVTVTTSSSLVQFHLLIGRALSRYIGTEGREELKLEYLQRKRDVASFENTSLAKGEKSIGKMHRCCGLLVHEQVKVMGCRFLMVLKPQILEKNYNPIFTTLPIL